MPNDSARSFDLTGRVAVVTGGYGVLGGMISSGLAAAGVRVVVLGRRRDSGRFDQDLRFGSEDLKGAFFLVKLIEDAKWPGMRHFDSHAYRTEDEQGVWDFAAGSMTFDLEAMRLQGYAYERLDQLTMEILLGVR